MSLLFGSQILSCTFMLGVRISSSCFYNGLVHLSNLLKKTSFFCFISRILGSSFREARLQSIIYKVPVGPCKRSFVLQSAQLYALTVLDTGSEHLVKHVQINNCTEIHQMLRVSWSGCAHAPKLLSHSLLAEFVFLPLLFHVIPFKIFPVSRMIE